MFYFRFFLFQIFISLSRCLYLPFLSLSLSLSHLRTFCSLRHSACDALLRRGTQGARGRAQVSYAFVASHVVYLRFDFNIIFSNCLAWLGSTSLGMVWFGLVVCSVSLLSARWQFYVSSSLPPQIEHSQCDDHSSRAPRPISLSLLVASLSLYLSLFLIPSHLLLYLCSSFSVVFQCYLLRWRPGNPAHCTPLASHMSITSLQAKRRLREFPLLGNLRSFACCLLLLPHPTLLRLHLRLCLCPCPKLF